MTYKKWWRHQTQKGWYLPNYWSEHKLVASRLIQNDVKIKKKHMSILSGIEIFEIITKLGQMGARRVKFWRVHYLCCYFPNYWPEYMVVAYRWIRNDERIQEMYITIHWSLKIFGIIMKICNFHIYLPLYKGSITIWYTSKALFRSLRKKFISFCTLIAIVDLNVPFNWTN